MAIDPRSGFDGTTTTFHSLRPTVPLPPPSTPLSAAAAALSLLPSPLPSHPAFIHAPTNTSLSFQQLIHHSRSLANALTTTNIISKSSVAFILSPNSLDIPILYFSLLSIGAVVCPANPLSTAAELANLVRLAAPAVAFTTASLAAKLPAHLKTIILDSPEFTSMLTANPPPASTAPEVLQSDVAAILFSSGTSGTAKAAAISHRNLTAQMIGFYKLRPAPKRGRSGPDVMLLAAPMFHSLGFMFLLRGVAMAQTTVVSGGGGVNEMLALVGRYKVTHMTAAPPVVVAMARAEEAAGVGALEEVICGGAPVPEKAARMFVERFPGADLSQGYGSTEGGGISRMINGDECRVIKSAGRLSENVQVKILDIDSGNFLGVGQAGEICLKSPSVMIGYVGDKEANALTFDLNGWMKTGDLGYIDQDGFLYIVDRLKELIKYKAYQVPPAELERLLQSLPGVTDVAVVPYPNEEVGEIPMALIVRESGNNITTTEIMEFIACQVAPYKKIRKVSFVNYIPKSPSGKILRKELRHFMMSNLIPKM